MKKWLMMAFVAVAVSGCVGIDGQSQPSQNIAMQIFSQAVDNKCRSELNEQSIYQAASLLMTQQQKQSVENKVCGCVSKKAPENISYKELGRAVIDSEARPAIVASVVGKTLKACMSDFLGY